VNRRRGPHREARPSRFPAESALVKHLSEGSLRARRQKLAKALDELWDKAYAAGRESKRREIVGVLELSTDDIVQVYIDPES